MRAGIATELRDQRAIARLGTRARRTEFELALASRSMTRLGPKPSPAISVVAREGRAPAFEHTDKATISDISLWLILGEDKPAPVLPALHLRSTKSDGDR